MAFIYKLIIACTLKVGIGVYIHIVTAMSFVKQNPNEITMISNTRDRDHTHKHVHDQIDQLIFLWNDFPIKKWVVAWSCKSLQHTCDYWYNYVHILHWISDDLYMPKLLLAWISFKIYLFFSKYFPLAVALSLPRPRILAFSSLAFLKPVNFRLVWGFYSKTSRFYF